MWDVADKSFYLQMKELHLADQLSDEDVYADKLIDCLRNLNKLRLSLDISPEIKYKLRTHGRKVRCEVIFEYATTLCFQ